MKKHKIIMKFIGTEMNKLLLLFLALCLMAEASEGVSPPERLNDPIFTFDASTKGSINLLPRELLKKLFKIEAKSEYFSNINMWVFADVTMPDGSRYLIVDGDHPISPNNRWEGKVEQLGGLVIFIKNDTLKVVTTTDLVFNDEYMRERGNADHLDDAVVAALAKDYVTKLVIFLGGVDSVKAKFSDLCDELLKDWVTSAALESELVKNELISKPRMKRIKTIHETSGCRK